METARMGLYTFKGNGTRIVLPAGTVSKDAAPVGSWECVAQKIVFCFFIFWVST